MLSQLCRHFFNWENGDSALFDRFAGESLVYLSYPNFIETWFVLALPLSFLAASNQLLHLIFATLAMFASDVIVDMSWNSGGDFTHRLSLLEQQEVSTPFVVFAHFLANLYVVVLECGRLYGHLKRHNILRNISRRFDWHCGKLEHSKRQFICSSRESNFFLFPGHLHARTILTDNSPVCSSLHYDTNAVVE